MKKVFASFLLIGFVAFTSCNSAGDTKVRSEKMSGDSTKETSSASNDSDEGGADGEMKKAAAAACDCMSPVLNQLSDRTKDIFITASNSDNPQQALQSEMMKITDQQEGQQIMQEMQKLAGIQSEPDVKACAERVDRQYKINTTDRNTQQKMMNAFAEADGCELVSAFMKIQMKSGGMQ